MSDQIRSSILRHLRYSLGISESQAALADWRTALSLALRDLAMDPWLEAEKRATDEDRKRVYYLSMEFLTGRLIEDAAINLGVRTEAVVALDSLGVSFADLVAGEPDPALGNGGLGRLAACYLESMSTLGLPAYGYGLRYERGLFRQSFDEGRQVEHPDEWLGDGSPWSLGKPETTHRVSFGGSLDGETWNPESSIVAGAFDTPVAGYGGRWVNTLRLWAATADANLLDLGRFNSGDFFGAADAETWAKTLSRVLYPADETDLGKRLRLSQEYFLTSASVQDLLERFTSSHTDLERLPEFVAIQMNDTHPAIAGPELIRLLIDEHGFSFDRAADVAVDVLGYTNHTLLPEALEHWSVDLMGSLLPRHLQIIEKLDARIHTTYGPAADNVHLIDHGQVRMGDLAAWTSHRVNGVSALHSELVKTDLFEALDELEPGRIVNVTNGITPRRWLKLANPALANLITETIGSGWETDLDRLRALEAHADDPAFLDAFGRAKHAAKQVFLDWARETHGIDMPHDALYDAQIKRIHEYKRQLLNILWTISRYQQIKKDPQGAWVPRVKIFGGKAAPSYAVAKDIIRLVNDVAEVVNNDPETKDLLRIVFVPNYNVTAAEKLIPAADLSEQISTAGMEASGTGNMKFALNGALTIGTLDGANVEIRDEVGPDNFFLFGLTTEEVAERREQEGHARAAIEASCVLREVLDAIAAGAFSPDEPGRYAGILDLVWNSDWFLVASDFDAYDSAQQVVDQTYREPQEWQRKAVLNIARMGFFSSDRAIREYMSEIWNVGPTF
ncbi:alpha-1,4 glucan phosphorylase [Microbacterium sorbitolivorans]|uniref:Alpha-1,4 glucan phosphorylase n=1 Tax=Microbacterium sorbitolivorans TaxID=1867410 RepID=A0A367Y1J0_9MICO|nr:glycogen/starch/alpha-glucan phosphorylase [Microbacterium sorbitolivorans]RCK59707.1 glycogen/starch/alpha-glucan phosphorylase [Microbacterium sorbitolivorans]GGF39243.1 alpha-1,4 glucan phosphorylase [Microbacterium sorbitolivorans]